MVSQNRKHPFDIHGKQFRGTKECLMFLDEKFKLQVWNKFDKINKRKKQNNKLKTVCI